MSLKALFRKKESASEDDEADNPFAVERQEIPAGFEPGDNDDGGGPALSDRLRKLVVGLPLGFLKPPSAINDDAAFDHPEVLAVIAADVADLPPPEVEQFEEQEEEAAEEPPAEDGDLAAGEAAAASGPDAIAALFAAEAQREADGFPEDMPAGFEEEEDEDDEATLAYKAEKRRNAIIGSIFGSAVLVVLVGGGWWLLSGDGELQMPGQTGLVVLNEHGEPVEVTQPLASGDRISMALPPPPAALKRAQPAAPAAEPPAKAEEAAAPTSAAPTPLPEEEKSPALPPRAQDTVTDLVARPELPPLPSPPMPRVPGANAPPMPTFAALPELEGEPRPLADAPVAELARQTQFGLLPMIAKDGRTSITAYGRPFEGAAEAPRVSIIVADLGLDPVATEAAIAKLPPEVTLAFSPYAPKLADQLAKARAYGHEVMIGLPLEPEGFPSRDPGPLGMLTALPQSEILGRLDTLMAKASGYVGLIGRFDGKFAGSRAHMQSVLRVMDERGVMFVHTGDPAAVEIEDIKVPLVASAVPVDERPFRDFVDARLEYLAEVAAVQGYAVGVIQPLPVSFERTIEWLKELKAAGGVLAPVTAAIGQARTAAAEGAAQPG